MVPDTLLTTTPTSHVVWAGIGPTVRAAPFRARPRGGIVSETRGLSPGEPASRVHGVPRVSPISGGRGSGRASISDSRLQDTVEGDVPPRPPPLQGGGQALARRVAPGTASGRGMAGGVPRRGRGGGTPARAVGPVTLSVAAASIAASRVATTGGPATAVDTAGHAPSSMTGDGGGPASPVVSAQPSLPSVSYPDAPAAAAAVSVFRRSNIMP